MAGGASWLDAGTSEAAAVLSGPAATSLWAATSPCRAPLASLAPCFTTRSASPSVFGCGVASSIAFRSFALKASRRTFSASAASSLTTVASDAIRVCSVAGRMPAACAAATGAPGGACRRALAARWRRAPTAGAIAARGDELASLGAFALLVSG